MLNPTFEKKPAFKLIGFCRKFQMKDSFEKIPLYYIELKKKYNCFYGMKEEPKTDIEKIIKKYSIMEFALCFNSNEKTGEFEYLIGGKYDESLDEIPNELIVKDIPELTFAVFDIVGPIPKSLQQTTTKVWKEWVPNNGKYKYSGGLNIEHYTTDCIDSPDCRSAIWVPVEPIK